MKAFRPAIILMHENGIAKKEIARLLSMPESTVRDDIRRYEETGSNENRPKTNAHRKTARTPQNIQLYYYFFKFLFLKSREKKFFSRGAVFI